MNIKLITDKIDIDLFLKEITKTKILSVDTEFIREKTYYPVLCLIQISVDNNVYIFDCLNNKENLEDLKHIFSNKKYVKIFHDADQDIEIINDFFSIESKNYFDTQLANAFIDLELHISYKNLVKKYLNIDIDKELQTSNWVKRPLSRKQIKYAANDVLYLEKIYHKISKELFDQKKSTWYKEELEKRIKDNNFKKEPKNAWKKIKLRDFSGINQNLFIMLSEYREEISRERNIPKTWFLSDKNIIKLSSKNYSNINDLRKENLNSNKFFHNDDYSEIFNKFDFSKKTYENLKQKRINVKKYQITLQELSTEFNISQQLIANKKDLENYFGSNRIQINGWRKKIFDEIKAKTK